MSNTITTTCTSASPSGVTTTVTTTEATPAPLAPRCCCTKAKPAEAAEKSAPESFCEKSPVPDVLARGASAMAAMTAGADLVPFSFTRRVLKENDILIAVKYCGLCHSDLHQVKNDWKGGIYPMVPGHEVVGVVEAVGSKVPSKFKVGARVGVGCMVDSCLDCASCEAGHENYCEQGFVGTYNGKIHDPAKDYVGNPSDFQPGVDGDAAAPTTWGGYATKIVVRQEFAISIPDGLSLEQAAPILCAGITMYSPIKHWGLKPGDTLGIMGLGGLGHMGLKVGKAMGLNVTVISHSPKKKAKALAMGADNFVVSSEKEEMAAAAKSCKLIIDTVSADHQAKDFLPLLENDGTLCIVGSLIGGIKDTQEVIDLCAKHQCGPEVEVIPLASINSALVKLAANDLPDGKYRFVLDCGNHPASA
eukprot:gene9401-27969_t